MNATAIAIRHHASRRTSDGFSLVEIMIALTIAVVLGLGLIQVFSAQRAAFSANESLARIQENSRFAMSYLQHDIRMTGNMTCLNELGFAGRTYNHILEGIDVDKSDPLWAYDIGKPLEVFEFAGTAPGDTYPLPETRATPGANAWNPPLPEALGIGDKALDGSDVIVVRYFSSETALLAGNGVNGATGDIEVADPEFVVANRVYAVTDCKNFSMFQALSGGVKVQSGIGGLNNVGWTGHENSYGPDVPIHEFRLAAYFVATGADGGPALFRVELGQDDGKIATGEELVAGVESLQAVLGADSMLREDGDQPNVYLTADAVETEGAPWSGSSALDRWRSVVSVRIGVLVRNNDLASVTAPDVVPRVADTRLTLQPDSRLRHVYEAQIALRNRVRG